MFIYVMLVTHYSQKSAIIKIQKATQKHRNTTFFNNTTQTNRERHIMAKKLSDEVMVERIQKWAMDNYEKGGDYIVECFSEDEIKEDFFHDYEGNRLNTWKEIFDRVKRIVRLREEQRKEIQSAW